MHSTSSEISDGRSQNYEAEIKNRNIFTLNLIHCILALYIRGR